MSVSFYDPENPNKYGNFQDGAEINFSNGNAAYILELMDLLHDERDLCGELDGDEFRRRAQRALHYAIGLDQDGMVDRIERMLKELATAKTVVWG